MGLSQLWELQEMQLRSQELQHQLQTSTLARELKREKERLESYQETVRAKIREREEIRQHVAELEKSCHNLGVKRKQIEGQLYSGGTNNPKELHNIQQKLEITAGELVREEERAMELALRQEQLEKWLAVNSSRLQAEKTAYREKLAQYRAWREGVQQEMDVLAVNVAQLEGDIEPGLRTLYSNLQRRLGTKALARVAKGICSGCHLVIPPLLLREIRAGKMIYCESCGRLLLP